MQVSAENNLAFCSLNVSPRPDASAVPIFCLPKANKIVWKGACIQPAIQSLRSQSTHSVSFSYRTVAYWFIGYLTTLFHLRRLYCFKRYVR